MSINGLEYDDEEDIETQHLQLMSQPFYTYDDQNDEQYYIIDNDSYDNTNSIDNAQHGINMEHQDHPSYLDHETGSIENTTVQAVK